MEKNKKKEWLLIVSMSIVVGFIAFLYLYGFSVLNVCNDTWLAGQGDLTQHYIGWVFYRASEWRFPFGMSSQIVYPEGISIVYTDSIPLFALFFKILSPILPDTFQYLGIFVLLCLILQAFFSVILVKRVTDSKLFWFFTCIFFVFSPIMLLRAFVHTALTAHFLILMAFCIWAYRNELTFICELLLWVLLGFLCVSIQMYFVPMVGLVLAARILEDLLKKQWKAVIHMVALAASVFLTGYLLGMFEGGVSGGTWGYGFYNANLNFLYNSMGRSRFLKEIPILPGQYEGLGYLGLGGLLLLFIAIILMILRYLSSKKNIAIEFNKKKILVYTILVIVTVALAMGNNVTWNEHRFVDIYFPDLFLKLVSIFRTSGRFIWVIVYGVLIFSVYTILRNSKKHIYSLVILAICTVLQLVDIGPFFKRDLQVQMGNNIVNSVEWESIADHYESVVLIDGIDYSIYPINRSTMFEFAWYAAKHGMTINVLYCARPITDIYNEQFGNYLSELESGNGNESNLYIFSKDYVVDRNYPGLNLYQIDDIVIGSYQKEELLAYSSQDRPVELYPETDTTYSMNLEYGLYRLDIQGDKLKNADFSFIQELDMKIIEHTDTKIVLYISATGNINEEKLIVNNFESIDKVLLFKVQ